MLLRQTEFNIMGKRDLEDATAVKLKKDLTDILECPVCLTVPRPSHPVYECINSHIICGDCAKRIPGRKCPTCRVIFSLNKRNRIAEKIIDKLSLEVPCIHAERGCNHTEKKSMITEHEANCGSRLVKCLDGECGEIINLDGLLDHAKQKHNSLQKDTTGRVISENFGRKHVFFIGLRTEPWHHDFHVYDGQTYVPILCEEHNMLYVMLYILASEEVAKKYKVTISISGKDFNMSYTTNIVPIDTPICETMTNEEKSLPLTGFQIRKCISKDCSDKGCLPIQFKVEKS
jgi:hypothetical protein